MAYVDCWSKWSVLVYTTFVMHTVGIFVVLKVVGSTIDQSLLKDSASEKTGFRWILVEN